MSAGVCSSKCHVLGRGYAGEVLGLLTVTGLGVRVPQPTVTSILKKIWQRHPVMDTSPFASVVNRVRCWNATAIPVLRCHI